MKSGTPAERRSNPSFFRIADLPGAPARLSSAGNRPITQPATAKWRPMEASAQWAVRRRRKRPEAVSAQRSVGPRSKGPAGLLGERNASEGRNNKTGLRTQRTGQRRAAGTRRAYGRTAAKSRTRSRPLFGQAMRPQARGRGAVPLERRRRTGGSRAGRRTGGAGRTEPHTQEAATAWPPCLHAGTAGTAGRPGKSGRSRGGGIVAAKDKPNRREPCRACGRWGGLNRSRRRTRPRRPGRPFLRGMPRTRAAGPGADGAAWVGEKVLQMSASDSRKSPAVMQSFCVKKLSLSSCQAIRSGVRSIRLET